MNECRFYHAFARNRLNRSTFLVTAHSEDEAHAKLAKARPDLREIRIIPLSNLDQGILLDSIEPVKD